MHYNWTHLPADAETVSVLRDALKIHPVLCRLLVQRGITDFDSAKAFFRPKLSDLHDPFLMSGMEAAVKRIDRAIVNEEKILLYGDYDADGTTAVALLYSFFKNHCEKLEYYIPDRYKEGYGVSAQGVDFAKQNGMTLIIAADCGIKATKQVRRAKELGIDFIICDHHLPGDELPPAVAVLDPKQAHCTYPYKELSGCGIAFKLAQAWSLKIGLPAQETTDLLDLVVISIACDIVEMRGENRVLAYFGLKKLNRTNRLGLQALIEKSGRTLPMNVSDIVFGIGPRINAVGRLENARTAVRLLLAEDKFVAYDLARTTDNYNKQRKEFDRQIAEEGKKMFRQFDDFKERKSIVLCKDTWHKGVLGIAASRMTETFHLPAIMLTESNGMLVGSARSVRGFNIHRAIESCTDLLENFGGHDFAAGLTLREENLSAFREKFEEYVKENISEAALRPELRINAELDFKDITPLFWKILKQFAPFGPGNMNPLFYAKGVFDSGYSKILKGNHLRLALKQKFKSSAFYGIAFGKGEYYPQIHRQLPFDIAYKLEENIWEGRKTLRFLARDFKFDEASGRDEEE